MEEIIVTILTVIMVYITYFSLFKILTTSYKEKLDRKFFPTVLTLSSSVFPIVSLIFNHEVAKSYIVYYFFIILMINIVIRKILKSYDVVLYTVIFYSLFIINTNYGITNDIYMSIFIIIIMSLIPMIKHKLFQYELIKEGGGNLSFENKKYVFSNLEMKDKDGNIIKFEELIKNFKDNKDLEKYLDSIIFKVYEERINKKLFYFHIIMGLLTIYFLLSQI
ncbi:hypothetical protein [Staphylococcus phage vB_StaM_PB50]|nr:hypothetical protein [Staphylococcus phage vB_StaM_PB50]